jgi:hypothetical protein
MALGLVVAIFCVGLVDKLTLGDWFHSPLACFRANIGEGVAAKYGVYPWTRYITWGRQNLLHISPFLFPLLFLGAFRKPRLALISVCAIAGHSVISHKEYRFLWPVLPLVFLMVAHGFEMAYLWLRQGWRRQHLTAVVGLSLLVGVAIRCWDIEWNPDPPRSSSLALAKLRHFPDVTGVALYQIGEGSSGNYFYLRRNIPLLTDPNRRNDDRQNLNICKARLRQNEGTVNYLITPSRNAFLFQEWRPEEVKIIHGMGIYRLHPRGGTVAQSS